MLVVAKSTKRKRVSATKTATKTDQLSAISRLTQAATAAVQAMGTMLAKTRSFFADKSLDALVKKAEVKRKELAKLEVEIDKRMFELNMEKSNRYDQLETKYNEEREEHAKLKKSVAKSKYYNSRVHEDVDEDDEEGE